MFHLLIFSDSFASSERFRLSLTLPYKSDSNRASFIFLDQSIQLTDSFNFENVQIDVFSFSLEAIIA